MLKEYLSTLANAFRTVLKTTDKINAQDFPDKINEVYEVGISKGQSAGYNEGYDVGYDEGKTEGQQTEYDKFWDIFQNYGDESGVVYNNAFSYGKFTDENYNPKYPIYVKESTTGADQMFYNAYNITDVKQPIYCNATRLTNTFFSSGIVTIPYLVILETVACSNTFTNCNNLKNITMGGTIGRSFYIKSSPLTVESAKSIITALKDYSGTDEEYAYTVTFSSEVISALEAEGNTAPHGGTWLSYIDSKKWNY